MVDNSFLLSPFGQHSSVDIIQQTSCQCVIDWPCENGRHSPLITLLSHRCVSPSKSHMWVKRVSNTGPAAPHHGVIAWNCVVNKALCYRPGIKAFSIHVFADPLALFIGANWIWLWLMNNRAWNDPLFNPYLPPWTRPHIYGQGSNKTKQVLLSKSLIWAAFKARHSRWTHPTSV